MMISPSRIITQSKEAVFKSAALLYDSGAYAESYKLLRSIERECEDDISFYINFALCQMRAEQWQTALTSLEKALLLIKKQVRKTVAFSPDFTYEKLTEIQAKNASYMCQIELELPDMLPEFARENVLRLMIDVCVKLELWDRVLLLGDPLKAKKYANVAIAIEAAAAKQKGK